MQGYIKFIYTITSSKMVTHGIKISMPDSTNVCFVFLSAVGTTAFIADLITELSIVKTKSVKISAFSWQFYQPKEGKYELVSSYIVT